MRGVGRAVMARAAAALMLAAVGFGASRVSAATCAGDCNGDAVVLINELITMVDVSLGLQLASACSPGDTNRDGAITVDEIVAAVGAALEGCAAVVPSPSPTPTLAPCTSQQTGCLLCAGLRGCCPAPDASMPSCFDPSVTCTFPCPTPIPANWIGSTECGPIGSAVACIVDVTPTPVDTGTATPTNTVPTSTATATATATPTITATIDPTPTATLGPCASELTGCSLCAGLGGCCPAPNPTTPSCFDPSVQCTFPCPPPIPANWIGSTECGPGGSAVACLVNPTPANASPTATASSAPPPATATASDTPESSPTPAMTATLTVTLTATPTGTSMGTATDTPNGSPTPTPTAASSSCAAGYRAFNFFNDCGQDIWPAAQNLNTSSGALYGWHMPQPPAQCSQSTDCPTGETCIGNRCAFTVCVPDGNQSATFWGRTDCQFDSVTGACPQATPNCCDSGNCLVSGVGNVNCGGAGANNSDPTTLGEISLATPTFTQDTYDVSIIDGFNLAIEIVPQGMFASTPSGNAGVYWCENPGCPGGACLGNMLGACQWNDLISGCPVAQQFKGYISGNVVGCVTGHNLCATGWPNPPTTAFACNTAVSNAAVSCQSNDDCPGLTGFTVNGASCVDVTCPQSTVCSTSNKYLNKDTPICELTCQNNVCVAPSCTANPDASGACPVGQQCCDLGTSGSGGQVLGTFMVCDLTMGSSTYQTCVSSTASLFLNTGTNGQSCYNDFAATTCSGCPTDPGNPLNGDWPTTATSPCENNNVNWTEIVGPSLGTFKQTCPTAYAYPFDDKTSTFSCQGTGDSLNNLSYDVIFCPQ